MRKFAHLLPLAALIITLQLTLTASADDSLEQRLRLFQENPRALLESVPAKKTIRGTPSRSAFEKTEIESRSFIEIKNRDRQLFTGRAGPRANDIPSDLIDNPEQMLTNLEEMQRRKLLKGEVTVQPWSDYYWPLYNGQTAYRYADKNFPAESTNWKKKSDFLLGPTAKQTAVDDLSPAEKYDLLVGDDRNSLTRRALAEGEVYYRSSGRVETWMGICHGWAPAAYMMDRPTNSVRVTAADGKTKITFYPADIKALASLLWASNAPPMRFIGGRCNTKNPKTDKNGRVKDQNCFDTNPGSWHQAVVNQIGINKKSFVLDATFDYEVWNQPIAAYSYTYFNPQTLKPVKSLKEAIVDVKNFPEDKFKDYRSPKGKFLVGISMDLDYVVETDPKQKRTDSPSEDALTRASYEYDLELDEKLNIVGGEWYQNLHPDFLWTAAPGTKALTPADDGLSADWSGKSAVPLEWQKAALRASEAGSPLAVVVEALVNLSQKNSGN